jgi:formamidopyrimidine-DNA glycosylase
MNGDDSHGQCSELNSGEARGLDHRCERLPIGKCPDALDQVTIGLAVAGDDFAYRRNGGEGIGIIELFQSRKLDRSELETEKPSSGLQNPKGFPQSLRDMRDVAQPEGDCIGIELPVCKAQPLGVAHRESQPGAEARRFGPGFSLRNHLRRNIGNRYSRASAGLSEDAQGHVSRPSGDIEDLEPAVSARRVEQHRHVVFPEPVEAPRHQIVHLIVTGCDLCKYLVDEVLLVVRRNLVKPKCDAFLARNIVLHPFRTLQYAFQHGYWPATVANWLKLAKVETMPELPEVETVRRGLMRAMVGRRIAAARLKRADLRFALPENFAARLAGQEVEAIDRRAKYLVASLSGGESLLMHLGMSGRFTVVYPDGRAANLGETYFENAAGAAGSGPHDHVVFLLDDGTQIVYTDPRRFGMMDLCKTSGVTSHRLMRGLGIEPLGEQLTASYLARALAGRKAPLKAALIDQRLIAGLGNIYACEALYRARLSPKRRAGSLVRKGRPDPRLRRLAAAIRAVLNDAVDAGGSTLRDYAQADGSAGGYQHRFSVYDREGEPCRRRACRGRIRRIIQAGRSTFYCPVCQH